MRGEWTLCAFIGWVRVGGWVRWGEGGVDTQDNSDDQASCASDWTIEVRVSILTCKRAFIGCCHVLLLAKATRERCFCANEMRDVKRAHRAPPSRIVEGSQRLFCPRQHLKKKLVCVRVCVFTQKNTLVRRVWSGQCLHSCDDRLVRCCNTD
jgi:hypothetical protein